MRLALTAVIGLVSSIAALASPPAPPAALADPQSAPKPPPFAVNMVDQGRFDPRLKGMLAPEGFQVEVVADDPVVTNPVGMTFSPDGVLYVLEWTVDPVTGSKWFEFKETFRYRDGSTKQIATMRKFVVDPVKVLLDRDAGTGVYPQSKPIIAEELPSSILWHDGWLYTSGRGTVRRYKKSRPNGPWDVREVIAQGFCGFHHHQVSGLTIGNDGKLYITSGDDDNFVEGSDGSRSTVLRTGAVFRCNPDGSEMETYSLGYRNPYRDLAFDDKFRFLHADNDNEDGSKFTGCRLMHVAEESDYGWRLRSGARCCRPDLTRGAVAGELPGKMPPMLRTGRGSPAGLLIYHDTKLPEHYRGLLYYPDVFRKVVRAYKVADRDSTVDVTHEFEFLKSDDPLFRPCQMVTGPDGAIYVCDWRTDSGGAGRLSGDGSHGRIYRMRWVGTPDHPAIPLRGMDSWAQILRLDDGALLDAFDRPDLTDRVEARKEFVRRAAEFGSPLPRLARERFLADRFSADGRLVSLGALQAVWGDGATEFFRAALNHPDAHCRRIAAEALGARSVRGNLLVHESLVARFVDADAGVRRAAFLAVGRVAAPGAADALVAAWRADDGRDVFLRDASLRAIERLGKSGLDALLVHANSGRAEDLDRVVNAFAALRTRPAADAIPELLANPHLTPPERVVLLQSYSNYLLDPALPVEPILAVLTARPNTPAPVVVAALAVVSGVGPNPPSAVAQYIVQNLSADDPDVRLAAVQAAEDTRLELAAPRLLTLLARADLPGEERKAVLRALKTTGGSNAVRPMVEYLARPEPAELKIEALRALATLSGAEARKSAIPLLDQADPKLVAEAINVLGATEAGAQVVAERYVARRLPQDTYPRVTEILSKFPANARLQQLAGEVQKGALLVSLDPAHLEEVRRQVLAKGDATRGKAVYLDTSLVACTTCHRMEGVGGQVGPDLTRVWDTHSIEKLLETILMPSKEIKEGYQSYKAATFSGQVHVGLKVADTDQAVTIRDASGRDIRIPREDLDELTASGLSLMPENTVAQLSFEQFLDLLAFLKSQSAQESLRGSVTEFQVTGLGGANFASPHPVEAEPNPLSTAGFRWEPRGASATGAVNLAGLVPPMPSPTGPSTVYALAYVHSPKPQKVTLAVTSSEPVKLFAAGKPLGSAPVAAGTAEGIMEANVAAGWTPVLLKMAATTPTPSLSLQARGEGIRVGPRPD